MHLKFLIPAFLLFFFMGNSASAQYVVTKAMGRIKTDNGEYIRSGSRLALNSKLTYESRDASIRAMGKDAKIYIFSANAATALNNGNGLFSQLLSQFIPTETTGSLSSRGDGSVDFVEEELKSNIATKVAMGSSSKYLFNVHTYPVGNGNKFFIELDNELDHTSTRRALHTVNDTLVIDQADLLPQEGSITAQTFTLGFLRSGRPEAVVRFVPNLDVTNDLFTITSTIVRSNNGNMLSKDSLRQWCLQHVYDAIGKPSMLDFNAIFNEVYAKRTTADEKPFVQHGAGYSLDAPNSLPKTSERVYSATRGALPSAYTLKKYVPMIGDQGMTSTCTSWAVAYAARSILYNYKYQLTNEYRNDKYAFSPEFIYFKIRGDGSCNNGTNIYKAINVIRNEGDVTSNSNLFDCNKQFTVRDKQNALSFTIKGGEDLNVPGKVIDNMKAAIANNKPVAIGINIPNYSSVRRYSFLDIPPNGIWQLRPEDYQFLADNPPYNGHAMCIIGYDNAVNGGSFEVMNSWGTDWGNRGFFWINYDDFKKVVNKDGCVYTVTDLSERPVVVKTDTMVVPKPVPVIAKQHFKGELKFFEVDKYGNAIAQMPITKNETVRSTTVTNDEAMPTDVIAYKINRAMANNAKYKVEYASKSPSYVYLLNFDGRELDTLFPLQHESPMIDAMDAALYLPGKRQSYTLGSTAATEEMCIIISRKQIDIGKIATAIQTRTGTHLVDAVKEQMPNRFTGAANFRVLNNSLGYDIETDDEHPLVFFINLKHN